MNVFIGLLMLAIGFGLLQRGGGWLASSAAAIARQSGAPLTVIGLITVAIEWEELALVAVALSAGAPRLAVGVLVGSSIANMTIVLAAGLLARDFVPTRVEGMFGWIVFGATLLVSAMAGAGQFGRREGVVLLLIFAGYALWLGRELDGGLRTTVRTSDATDHARKPTARLVHGALGLMFAAGGGELAVRGALRLANSAGLSETVVGLTLVALGVSLPDTVTSLIAARKGTPRLALANVAGANVCNLLLLLGLVAVAQPIAVPSIVTDLDAPVLLTVTALFVLALRRPVIGRGYGIALVCLYGLYLVARLA